MKTNIKDITFGPEHVGMKATDIFGNKGMVVGIKESDNAPVKFRHTDDNNEIDTIGQVFSFRTDGTFSEVAHRCLFLGHDVELTIIEQDFPEEKLLCPVCDIEHEPIGTYECFILHTTSKAIHPNCPFSDALYLDKHTALKAYKTVCELGSKEIKSTSINIDDWVEEVRIKNPVDECIEKVSEFAKSFIEPLSPEELARSDKRAPYYDNIDKKFHKFLNNFPPGSRTIYSSDLKQIFIKFLTILNNITL